MAKRHSLLGMSKRTLWRGAVRSALLTGSLSALVAAGITISPQPALAQCVPAGDTVTCSDAGPGFDEPDAGGADRFIVVEPGTTLDPGINILNAGAIDAFVFGPGTTIIGGTRETALYLEAMNDVFVFTGPGTRLIGTGNGSAIDVSSSVGMIEIQNTGLLQNVGDLALPTVRVTADGDAIIHNQAGGIIRNATGDTSMFAIGALSSDGNVVIRNDGTIIGNMSLMSFGGQGVTFDNNGIWNWSGDNSFFSNGDIIINNNAGAVANAFPGPCAENCYTFIAPGDAIINNAGTLNLFISAPFSENVFDFFGVGGRRLFNNTGTFNTDGEVIFDTLQAFNNSGGTINTSSATVFQFLQDPGNISVLNNSGIININPSGQPNGLGMLFPPFVFPASFTAFLNADANFTQNLDLEFNNAGGVLSMVNNVSSYAGQGTPQSVLANAPPLGFAIHDLSAYRNRLGDATFIGGNFHGGSGSTLAVDAFLSNASGSASDLLIVGGNVTGKAKVVVNNTNPGGGALNTTGILVATALGNSPAGSFTLANGPIDTGFFDYDLFFVPRGSGDWVLRSFAGGGAAMLPQLVTAAQDIWHQTSSTWFDRSADLRVLLHGGAAPAAYDPTL
ncbi:MAG: pertactin-like passenger domain-containing protein, partial [Methyloceanibacter sp.]